MPISTLPAGHVPTAAELKSITDTLTTLANNGIYTVSAVSPAVNFTTTSYADFTGAALSFAKLQDSSNLRVRIDVTGYLQTAQPRQVYLAVKIGATDYQVSQFNFNDLANHKGWSGTAIITGIPTGSYTIQVRGKISGAGATATFDGNDTITLTVEEIPT